MDWGLGHAVRMIPIIHLLRDEGYDMIIGGTGKSGDLLKEEFPEMQYYELPGANIRYSGKFLLLKILLQVPKFLKFTLKEKKFLNKIISDKKIDLIISDNRYGIYHEHIPSIFVSHQIRPKLSKALAVFENFVEKIHKRFLKPFKEIVIPDYKGAINLAGDLSQSKLSNDYTYIGPLSQFFSYKSDHKKIYDILIILSGPEPQRSYFEKIMLSRLTNTKKQVLIVRAKPGTILSIQNKNVKVVDHLNRKDMYTAVMSSRMIISRAGYTTIMDLIALQKKAILVPTPGQTEQEYLAMYLSKFNLFIFKDQTNFDIENALIELDQFTTDFEVFKNAEKDSVLEIIKKYV